jgi:hypothetical protein
MRGGLGIVAGQGERPAPRGFCIARERGPSLGLGKQLAVPRSEGGEGGEGGRCGLGGGVVVRGCFPRGAASPQ